jgi:hypothetical protein
LKKILLFTILVTGLFSTPELRAQFQHQLKGNRLPWTKAPEINGNTFRFVIISDLTGGEKEGVFASVVDKINQLAPDFVMCVGDLIDGYTIDSAVMNRQWKSFHERISKLKAPFFYMPGNHDVANRMLYDDWIRQYGYDFYSFYSSGSLFIILDCYESEKGVLSDRQVKYLKEVLLNHDPEKPVYVFSHPPLWDLYGKKGLKELETDFYRYRTTFFCGDDHHYVMKNFNNRNHYMLSNSGGGFTRENISLGIFNHILWVTSAGDSLTIANILTDGIIPADIVSNENEKQVYSLLQDDWLTINPTYITKGTAGRFNTMINVRNGGDFPVEIKGRFPCRESVSFVPDSFSFIVPERKTVAIPVSLINNKHINVEDLPETAAEITARYFQPGKITENSYRKKWIIDNLKYCGASDRKVKPFRCESPAFIEESWSWSGPADGSFTFSCTHDKDNIILEMATSDDILVTDSVRINMPQDKLILNFSADTSMNSRDQVVIEMTAGKTPVATNASRFPGTGIMGICSVKNKALFARILIPLKNLKSEYFRLNIGFRDQDDRTSSDQSILWWRPPFGSGQDYPGSGTFKITER